MNPLFWIEGVLIVGAVLAFAAWELWSLRDRPPRKEREGGSR